MIPKIIHYCWFGGNKKPKLIKKCIRSWKRLCPDYDIIEWNECNFDVNMCTYTKEAYESKKWAFVSDYCRFYVLNKMGGIYVDTDVELLKNIDELLSENFMGFENKNSVVSRETLMLRLWEIDSYIEENTLTVNINRLRKKLSLIGLDNLIKTKIGRGYIVE